MPPDFSKLSAEEKHRLRIFGDCQYFLHGHKRQSLKARLEELAEFCEHSDGPDYYGAGPLIRDFEADIAARLGKPAAVFMPSGTMAQQIALRLWCDRQQIRTVAYHPTCHLEIHCQQTLLVVHNIRARLIGEKPRLFGLDELKAVAEPLACVLIELPQREIGGLLPSWDELTEICRWARDQNIRLHMDGARLWESRPFFGQSLETIAGLFDSVYVSVYKGLGGMTGALLCGDQDFVAEARCWQQRLGGTLIHQYPFVLAAKMRIEARFDRFDDYHQRAKALAQALTRVDGVQVKPDPPQSHMMHVFLSGRREALLGAAVELAEREKWCLFRTLRETDVPNQWGFELCVGDAALELKDEDVERHMRWLMTKAASDQA